MTEGLCSWKWLAHKWRVQLLLEKGTCQACCHHVKLILFGCPGWTTLHYLGITFGHQNRMIPPFVSSSSETCQKQMRRPDVSSMTCDLSCGFRPNYFFPLKAVASHSKRNVEPMQISKKKVFGIRGKSDRGHYSTHFKVLKVCNQIDSNSKSHVLVLKRSGKSWSYPLAENMILCSFEYLQSQPGDTAPKRNHPAVHHGLSTRDGLG